MKIGEYCWQTKTALGHNAKSKRQAASLPSSGRFLEPFETEFSALEAEDIAATHGRAAGHARRARNIGVNATLL